MNWARRLVLVLMPLAIGLQSYNYWYGRHEKARMTRMVEASMHTPPMLRHQRCAVACLPTFMHEPCLRTCEATLREKSQGNFEEAWGRCMPECVFAGAAEAQREACASQCVVDLVNGREFHYRRDGGAPERDGGALSPWVAMIQHEAQSAESRRGLQKHDRVKALLVDGQSIWAANSGLHVSVDGGVHFTPHPFPLFQSAYRDASIFVVANGQFWVAVKDGLLRSSDGGASWSEVNSIGSVKALVADGDKVFVATPDGVRRVSIDRTFPNSSFNGDEVDALFVTSDHALLAATPEGIFRSQDGAKFHRVMRADPISLVNSFAADGEVIFAAGEMGNELWRSRDRGKHWSPIEANRMPSKLTSLVADKQVLYAGSDHEGVHVSRDGGLNWEPLWDGLEEQALVINALAKSADGVIYAATNDGIYRLVGRRWTPLAN